MGIWLRHFVEFHQRHASRAVTGGDVNRVRTGGERPEVHGVLFSWNQRECSGLESGDGDGGLLASADLGRIGLVMSI